MHIRYKCKKNADAQKVLLRGGRKVRTIGCNVSDEQALKEAFNETLNVFGKTDVCFANAGAGGGAPFHEFPTVMWRKVMAVNLDGTFFTFREAAKHMIKRKKGGR